MQAKTVEAILLGLLISGGMLIPGNIPNIIAAGKLNISSKEWARAGLSIGIVIMVVYFVILLAMGL
jgi:predicted cation transporter